MLLVASSLPGRQRVEVYYLTNFINIIKMKTNGENNIIKKCKMRNGKKIKKDKVKIGKGIKKTFKNIVSITKDHLKKFKPKCKKAAIDLAIAVAKEIASDSKKSVDLPRIIPVPKVGGFLPLIPIFAGLSAVGGIAGGAAGIARAVNAIKSAKQRLQELKRHDKKMEEFCIGNGLYLKEHGKGLGIYAKNKKN